jgi:hypothetical protein
LVPAIMKLAGGACWWAPSLLRRMTPPPRPRIPHLAEPEVVAPAAGN